MRIIITCIIFIFFITGCSFNPIDSSAIPLGNSIGNFQYVASIKEEPILDNNKFTVGDIVLIFNELDGFNLDSSSSSNVLLYSKDKETNYSISVYPIEINSIQNYKESLYNKILELYPSGEYSFDGSISSITNGDITWDVYRCTINEKEIEGYLTFYENYIIAVEFSGSFSDRIKDDLKNSIIVEKEIENDK